MKLPEREAYRYQSHYCEENIWYLCQQPEFQHSDVIVIASKGKFFPILCQRAADVPEEPTLWDYHVVLLWHTQDARYILDFDTTLPFCTLAEDYCRQAFLDDACLKSKFVPWFRVMPAGEYATRLLSDRRHMRTASGGWQAEPPDWPPTSASESNLYKFTDMNDPEFGQIMSVSELLQRCYVNAGNSTANTVPPPSLAWKPHYHHDESQSA
jgi:hypothetical protein